MASRLIAGRLHAESTPVLVTARSAASFEARSSVGESDARNLLTGARAKRINRTAVTSIKSPPITKSTPHTLGEPQTSATTGFWLMPLLRSWRVDDNVHEHAAR